MKRIIASIFIFAAAVSAMAETAKPALSKDETVFAILDPTGRIESVYVSDWIHSEKAGSLVHDRSSLSNIENVKGKEVPSRSGDELTWKLSGQDLYYRGTTAKALPLSVSVRYFLDGKAIAPAALAGKSGRVTVRVNDLDTPVNVGMIELYRFQNPEGLSTVGENLYKQTPASGASFAGRPGFDGFGKSIHKFLEMSNVSTVSEMVNMIVAQRAYEFNSKAIQTSDNMLQTAASLKR